MSSTRDGALCRRRGMALCVVGERWRSVSSPRDGALCRRRWMTLCVVSYVLGFTKCDLLLIRFTTESYLYVYVITCLTSFPSKVAFSRSGSKLKCCIHSDGHELFLNVTNIVHFQGQAFSRWEMKLVMQFCHEMNSGIKRLHSLDDTVC